MIKTSTCINVYSEMNTWIDFCIVIGAYEDLSKAEEVVQQAYDDWFELSDAQFEPIADYITARLTDEEIEYEIYFKEDKNNV